MATSLDAYLALLFQWTYDDSTPELSTPRDNANIYQTYDVADGSGALQSNLMWHDRRRLTPSSPFDDLDLAGGLSDVFGNTLIFSNVKAMLIVNKGVPNASPATAWTPTAGEDLDVGDAPSNPVTGLWGGSSPTGAEKIRVMSGGSFAYVAMQDGFSVAAGSADVLRVALEGGGSSDVDYDIVIIGS